MTRLKRGPKAARQLQRRARNDRSPSRGRRRRTWLAGAIAIGVIILGVGLARLADRSDSSADPDDPSSAPNDLSNWLERLDRLRVEGRDAEAEAVAWEAYERLPPSGRPAILASLTLALLADVPRDAALERLNRRLEADPNDLDARLARLLRSAAPSPDLGAAQPRLAGAPASINEQIERLEAWLETNPDHAGTRLALAELELERGRAAAARRTLEPLLKSPPLYISADLDRLIGRVHLKNEPARAAAAFERALERRPHDWKTRALLARAYEALGLDQQAARESQLVEHQQELLAPQRLGPRLARALERLDNPEALGDLARLCDEAGLNRLARAWRLEAETAALLEARGGR